MCEVVILKTYYTFKVYGELYAKGRADREL